MSLDGVRKLSMFVEAPGGVAKHSTFAPNGRWLAYMSAGLSVGGLPQVFVQPFPSTGGKYLVSPDYGRTPLWSPDGRQLFYHDQSTNRLMVVDIRTEPSFAAGTPTPLPIAGTIHPVTQRNYDITPDGKRLLVVLPASSGPGESSQRPPQQINVVLNWQEELKARLPAK